MNVIFMGTPEFSLPALDAILEAGHNVVAVYCQPPRPAGRGKNERASPVQERAQALGLTLCMPVSLRDPAAQTQFAGFAADVAVVVAYGLILPQAVLDAPMRGCLNIHASLLPRWRGAAPIQRAIMAGDEKTGICIMAMDAGLDTGPILLRREMPIGASDTAADLHDRLSNLGASMVVEVLKGLSSLKPLPQPDAGVIYATKIYKSEARIDWTRSARELDRLIRALSPFPGAWCEVSGERVKLLRSRLAAGQGAPGQVIGEFTVACGEGAVEITLAQRPGKTPMAAADLLLGWKLPPVLG